MVGRQTKEQILDTRFELFLYRMLLELGEQSGYCNVVHNAEVHRARYLFRQVDILYTITHYGIPEISMLEAKYSSRGPIHYSLRRGLVTKAGQFYPSLDNVVIETEERRRFIGAQKSFLVTNTLFDEAVHRHAPAYGLSLIEGHKLGIIWHNLGHRESIDNALDRIGFDAASCALRAKTILSYPLAYPKTSEIVVHPTTTRSYIRNFPLKTNVSR
jgi:hypothetical protein